MGNDKSAVVKKNSVLTINLKTNIADTAAMFLPYAIRSNTIASIDAEKADEALAILKAEGENAWIIGDVCSRNGGKEVLISDLEEQA